MSPVIWNTGCQTYTLRLLVTKPGASMRTCTVSPTMPAALEITSGMLFAPGSTTASNDPVPAVPVLGETNTTALSRLVTRTVTPPWFVAPSVAPMLRCSPEPRLEAATAIPGKAATFAVMLSTAKPAGPATKMRVVQGSAAEPPYVTSSTVLTSPAPIVVALGVTAAQVAFATVNETGTPPAGAATGVPPLSSRTVIGAPKLPLSATDVATMFNAAVTFTTVRSSA